MLGANAMSPTYDCDISPLYYVIYPLYRGIRTSLSAGWVISTILSEFFINENIYRRELGGSNAILYNLFLPNWKIQVISLASGLLCGATVGLVNAVSAEIFCFRQTYPKYFQ